MIEKDNFNKLLTYILVIGLFFLAYLTVKPLIYAIIYGILLGYIFYPLNKWLLKIIKNPTATALIICLGVLIIILSLVSLILGTLLNQLIDLYLSLSQADLVGMLTASLPSFLSTLELPTNIIGSLNTFISNVVAHFFSQFGDFILNLPLLILKVFVAFFIFFYALRDGKIAAEYIKTLSPLKKEDTQKFFQQFKEVTKAVIIGQIIVGIMQGIVAGVGYFIFGIPNALLLTLLTILAAIIPIIGPWLVWIPIVVYLLTIGKTTTALGLLIYGTILVGGIDNLIRPFIVSRRTQLNSAIVLVGMIGGLFVFGLIGLIIGPLVLAYVILVLEIYKKRSTEESILFVKKEEDKK